MKIIFTLILLLVFNIYYIFNNKYEINTYSKIRFINKIERKNITNNENNRKFILDIVQNLKIIDSSKYCTKKEFIISDFKKGYGNDCSSNCFAMGALLLDKEIDFEIIVLLNSKRFNFGENHTILHTDIGNGIQLLDVYARKSLSVNNIYNPVSWKNNIKFINLNQNTRNLEKKSLNEYYEQFYEKNTKIGIIKKEEVNDYFQFIDLIHTKLFEGKYEKIITKFLAICFNKNPKIYIENIHKVEIEKKFNKFVILNYKIFFILIISLFAYTILLITRIILFKFR